MKANTVQLPNLATAVPSQPRGDRTDGPKLWDKASLPNTQPSPQGICAGHRRERLHAARINTIYFMISLTSC